ncbi:hypothetical protein E3E31_12050 [Thermococcus sp. M39]|uniref:hypothetical protein n=1 Tax=Thermococcus sp. M39 TaxID=1638262 RepID=UPI001438D3DE|nr:hypothetical protein [Thermococcus sp. M39]NJE09240.1 hypothetical protein [Thermococcus sp. M39]
MADYYKKLSWGRVLIRTLIAIGMFAFIMKYAMDKSVTASDFVEAIQATPFALVVFLDAMDAFIDKTAYYKLYNRAYVMMGGQGQGQWIQSLLAPVAVSAVIFFGMLAMLGGAVTINLGEYNPGVLVWVGMMSAYAMLPETGDEPWMTIIWLAAQLVGGFHHVVILPAGLLG